jgi:hypothetical protein
MNKLSACVFIVAWLGVAGAGAPAMPFSTNHSQGNLVAPVAGGCGIGWHRSPYGGCTRNIYGLFGMGFYYVPHPSYRPSVSYDGPAQCKGRGGHNVCDIFGQCWWACN